MQHAGTLLLLLPLRGAALGKLQYQGPGSLKMHCC